MVDRISLSHRQLSLDDIAIHHLDVEAALFEFFPEAHKPFLSATRMREETRRGTAL